MKRSHVACSLAFVSIALLLMNIDVMLASADEIDPGDGGGGGTPPDPVTVPYTTNIHFPDASHSTLSFAIETWGTYEGYTPIIEYSVDERTDDPYTRYFYIYVDDQKVYNGYISNDKSGSIYTDLLKTSGVHQIKIEIYWGGYSNGPYYLNYLKVGNLLWDSEIKIGVFFWASDAGIQSAIDNYIDILWRQNYAKFFEFKDCNDVEAACDQIDAFEDGDDTVFVYIIGHGNNDGSHSYTAFRPSASIVYSNDFRTWLDRWESPRKCLFVESCHSGDWADDFAATPYLAMSTSDETHVSYAMGPVPNEGKMSHYFFEHVDYGYTAVQSFNYAASFVDGTDGTAAQYPKIRDYSTYVWFD